MKSFRMSRLVGVLSVLAVSASLLAGCASAPTQTQKDLIDDAANIAVAVLVQGDSNDPAVWSAKAAEVVAVVEKLEVVAGLDTATVADVSKALAPLLAKANLTPLQRTAANRLVVRLSNEIKRRVDSQSVEVVEVRRVLAEVKTAAQSFL